MQPCRTGKSIHHAHLHSEAAILLQAAKLERLRLHGSRMRMASEMAERSQLG